jgi:hypothetical protein
MLKTVGIAAVGVAGGGVLAEAISSPASATTLTEPGALAPAVVGLSDASTITVDASLGNDFRVTIAGNRTMADPTNATDGQKIVFQITQGAGGSFTLTWGSGYLFSPNLPQPTLSTPAGQTDLLAFIYNAALGKWLLVAYVVGFSAAGLTQSGGPYRLFPSTDGPSSPANYSGPFLAGLLFEVTTGGTWLDGFWWWVTASGQSTAPQKFALWSIYNNEKGTLVSSATATSGTLSPGGWNYIQLATPVPLAIGATYVVATGLTGNFPSTAGQFGSGEVYGAGIVNGPLTAYSDLSGSRPAPYGMNQALYGTQGSDPTVNLPGAAYQSSNFWLDLQVGTTAPQGTSFRLWPNYPTLPGGPSSETAGYVLATEFQISQPCSLNNIWFYSGAGAGALPTRCAIWDVATQTAIAGTDSAAPSWSGPAGSGWVSCAYSGVTLPAGDYKVAVFYPGGTEWFFAQTNYWGSGGPAANGIVSGPLSAPGITGATAPGQSTYNPGSWAYPLTYGTGGNGENFWVDVEVTPS